MHVKTRYVNVPLHTCVCSVVPTMVREAHLHLLARIIPDVKEAAVRGVARARHELAGTLRPAQLERAVVPEVGGTAVEAHGALGRLREQG